MCVKANQKIVDKIYKQLNSREIDLFKDLEDFVISTLSGIYTRFKKTKQFEKMMLAVKNTEGVVNKFLETILQDSSKYLIALDSLRFNQKIAKGAYDR